MGFSRIKKIGKDVMAMVGMDNISRLDDKLAEYAANAETYGNFLNRVRHIVAVLYHHPPREEWRFRGESIKYEKETDNIHFVGKIRRSAGSSVGIEARFPFSFIDNATDEEIAKWRDSLNTAHITPELKSDYALIEKLEFPDKGVIPLENCTFNGRAMSFNWDNIELGPLSTKVELSKKQLIEYLQKADIPDDAELTLQFDDGEFYLYFYWSEGAGAFGHRAVNFDIENRELILEVDKWSAEDAKGKEESPR